MSEKSVTVADVEAATLRLKPCPFCGEPVDIAILDDDGNYKGRELLEDDPYSGLAFGIAHPLNEGCLLYTYPCEYLGTIYWPTLDELVTDWNKRHNPQEVK